MSRAGWWAVLFAIFTGGFVVITTVFSLARWWGYAWGSSFVLYAVVTIGYGLAAIAWAVHVGGPGGWNRDLIDVLSGEPEEKFPESPLAKRNARR